MKPLTILLGAMLPLTVTAASIDQATITEVVNSVSVIDRSTKKSAPAKVQQSFNAPNVLRTGADSRAEMVAPDQTVTRVGQNTLFSFQQDSREINLDKGSILFQSPSGKGGGTIRTSAASAAVLGTTLIVTATQNGGFKVLLLEGKGKVTGAGGTRMLNAGQLVYAMPGGKISNVFSFQLREQTGASKLVRGFKRPLPSLGKIAAAVAEQEKEISTGKVKVTGLLASGSPDYAYKLDAAYETQKTTDSEGMSTGVSPFVAAVTSNAVITNPALDTTRIFGPGYGTNEFASDPVLFGLATAQSSSAGGTTVAKSPAVFLGNNIFFDTASVDLAPFAGRDLVQFFATADIGLNKSVDFGNFSGGQLFISAGGTIRNAPGVTIRASSNVLALLAFGHSTPMTDMPQGERDVVLEKTLSLQRLNLVNETGAIAIGGGNMNLLGFQAAAPRPISVSSSGSVHLDRAANSPDVGLLTLLTNDGALPPGYSNLFSNGSVRFGADQNLTIHNTSIRAPRINMNAQNITLERVRINDTSSLDANPIGTMPNSAQVRLAANDLLSISGVRFSANDMYMQARTISLADVNFRSGSRVWLESALGVLASGPNTNASIVPGKVNFVRNVRYGGNAISGTSDPRILQNGLPVSGSTPQGPGIVIRPRGR